MAYQSLNIIGSFTQGATAIQREVAVDRERAETYRTLLRDQVVLRNRGTLEDVSGVEADDRLVVGDGPHSQRRNPYLFLRYPRKERRESEEPTSNEPGGSLDVVV